MYDSEDTEEFVPDAPDTLERTMRTQRLPDGGDNRSVMGAVRGRQPFPHHTMQHVLPSCRVRRAAHYMTAMGLWRPPVAPGIRGPLPVATCPTCMSCGDCFPEVPL